jgi:hypothetical protein
MSSPFAFARAAARGVVARFALHRTRIYEGVLIPVDNTNKKATRVVAFLFGVPKGIRTPVTTVKGSCPRPLDDGDVGTSNSVQLASRFVRLHLNPKGFGGDKRDRTADLLHAMQALSQLSYTPEQDINYSSKNESAANRSARSSSIHSN